MLNCTVQVLKLSEFKDLQYIYTPCILKKTLKILYILSEKYKLLF